MWFRKEKTWSRGTASLSLGYDLWGWAIPLLIDVDYGEFRLRVLCLCLSIALKDVGSHTKDSASRIIRIVASHFGLPPSDLTGPRRDEFSVEARWIAMYLIRQDTDFTLAQTGAALGGRSPATISHGYGIIATRIKQEARFRNIVEDIRNRQ